MSGGARLAPLSEPSFEAQGGRKVPETLNPKTFYSGVVLG